MVGTKYCSICGLKSKKGFEKFGEGFCSKKHANEFVLQTRKQKLAKANSGQSRKKSISGFSNFFTPLENSINILLNEKYAKTFFVAFSISLIFFSFLNGLFLIPFLEIGFGRMAEVTVFDYLYLTFSSILIAVLVSLFFYQRNELTKTFDSGNLVGTGSTSLAGFLAAICPVCQSVSLAAFGATVLAIPLGPLIPVLGFLKFFGLGLLGLSVYIVSNNIYKKTCTACAPESLLVEKKLSNSFLEEFFLKNNWGFSLLVVFGVILVLNQFLLTNAFSGFAPQPGTAAFLTATNAITVDAKSELNYGAKITIKPMPLAVNEASAIAGYKTKVKSLPTISEIEVTPSTGDLTQDIANNVIPKGKPWYSEETGGISFDDAIKAQQLWARGRAIQLSPEEQKRWDKIVNSFTCDYCCGSPQNPTIITRCGCAHSYAAQGMAKWFIKNYGDKFSDEEIYGEMARWYALWYPGPTVKRIVQEIQSQSNI